MVYGEFRLFVDKLQKTAQVWRDLTLLGYEVSKSEEVLSGFKQLGSSCEFINVSELVLTPWFFTEEYSVLSEKML